MQKLRTGLRVDFKKVKTLLQFFRLGARLLQCLYVSLFWGLLPASFCS
jgi:hypothetical protein